MKKAVVLSLVLILTSTLGSFANDEIICKLGGEVKGLKLKDLSGKEFDLDKVLKKDEVKGVVFVFISYTCPGSISNDSRYIQHTKNFKEKGVLFVGISSNYNESEEDMRKYAEKTGYNFPVLKDHDNIIADRFAAMTTPHAFVVSKDAKLLYSGRIDDSNRDPEQVKDATLANAVDEYLAGKELSVTKSKPGG